MGWEMEVRQVEAGSDEIKWEVTLRKSNVETPSPDASGPPTLIPSGSQSLCLTLPAPFTGFSPPQISFAPSGVPLPLPTLPSTPPTAPPTPTFSCPFSPLDTSTTIRAPSPVIPLPPSPVVLLRRLSSSPISTPARMSSRPSSPSPSLSKAPTPIRSPITAAIALWAGSVQDEHDDDGGSGDTATQRVQRTDSVDSLAGMRTWGGGVGAVVRGKEQREGSSLEVDLGESDEDD